MVSEEKLFDEFIQRDDSPAKYQESIFHAFNRLSWANTVNIRKELDEWFHTYPENEKHNLRSRFRSNDNSTHQGAFFELAIFQLLTKLEYCVQVNPLTIQGKTPDFLVKLASEESFYVETTVSEPIIFHNSPTEKEVFDRINKINCPDFSLCIETNGILKSSPPLKKMQYEIQAWINGLDYEEANSIWVINRQFFSFTFKHESWTLIVKAIPKRPASKGKIKSRTIGFGPTRAGFIDSRTPILNAIHDKGKNYKGINQPLIVAVNTLDLVGIQRDDIIQMLFGYESSTDDSNKSVIMITKGVYQKNQLWDKAKNTSISAVLLFEMLQPHTIANSKFCLYENPWASHPVPLSLRSLPHVIMEDTHIKWHEGKTIKEIFNLQPDWPGPKNNL